MASLVAKAAAYKEIKVADDAKKIDFTDSADIAAWAGADVDTAVGLGIINGIPADDGTTSFDPKANATRAHAATMLSQLYDLF